jgi:TRAP-type transport system periplasmic protein
MTDFLSQTMRHRLALLALLLAAPFLLAACGGDDADEAAPEAPTEEAPEAEEEEEAPDETVRLRVVSFLATDHQFTRETIPMWSEHVERESDGSLQVEWTGGPDAVPVEDQFAAVRDGLVEVGFNVPVFYPNEAPAAQTMQLSPFPPGEERENGYFEYLDRVHRDGGVAYLGRWLSTSPFYLWVNDPVETLQDMRGRRLRSVPTYHHILQALGATPVNILPGEVFTALERGVVQGYGFPLLGPREQGWTEVTRYLINEPFYNQNGAILINPGVYDGLSDRQREALERATRAFEEDMVQHFRDINEQEWQALQEVIEPIELSEEESDAFVNLWYDETWSLLEGSIGADDLEEARQLLNHDELQGSPDRIRDIPCAGIGSDEAADEEFC